MFDVKQLDFEFQKVVCRSNTSEALHRVVLMQSTGLHDKNGVEIFVGDIVRFPATWIQGKPAMIVNAVVSFEKYADGEQYGDDEHLGWILKFKINGYESRETLPDARPYSEVIDNIYQNPDHLPQTA
jgi:uncharacterized phage protein (TIGR01671 family)